MNIPLEAGAGDADYRLAFDQAVIPILDAFAPEVLLISAGYDAHDRDPLGGMRVSTEGYTEMTRQLRVLADRRCDGRLVVVTEGGYDLDALEACLAATLAVVQRADTGPSSGDGTSRSTRRAEAALDQVRAAQGRFWPTL